MAAGDLTNISGLGKLSIELLETVGIESLDALSRGNADQLLVEITRANGILKIRKKAPTTIEIQKWIGQACELTGYDPESEIVKLDAIVPEVEEVLVAIPVSGKSLVEKGIKASEVPVIEVIERSKPPLKTDTARRQAPDSRPKEKVAKGVFKDVTATSKEKIKPNGRKNIESLKSTSRDVRTRTSPGLNDGKKEHSRSFIRGVLYPQAGRIRAAALVAVLFFISIPVALLGAALIILNREVVWVIAPAVTLVLGILYLMVAVKIKCRICGQPLYVSKGCHKHVKAHHIPVIGYILPMSLHLLLFGWFRCTYCGTSIRLKE
ncbi:MAG: DUF4332 domain-containing protein [Akkermansiaceae bacterium]